MHLLESSKKAVPYLRRIVAGLLPRWLGFNAGPVRMGFMVF